MLKLLTAKYTPNTAARNLGHCIDQQYDSRWLRVPCEEHEIFGLFLDLKSALGSFFSSCHLKKLYIFFSIIFKTIEKSVISKVPSIFELDGFRIGRFPNVTVS